MSVRSFAERLDKGGRTGRCEQCCVCIRPAAAVHLFLTRAAIQGASNFQPFGEEVDAHKDAHKCPQPSSVAVAAGEHLPAS